MTIVNKAAMTQEASKPVKSRSTFPLNQRIAGGYRFGLYQPCYAEDYNPDETLPVKSAHDIRSMNLKSPMLGNVSLHKDYFDVPFTVLLPLNYEKWAVQPSVGDDVDAQEVGLNVEALPLKLIYIINKFKVDIADKLYGLQAQFDDDPDHPLFSLDFAEYFDRVMKLVNSFSLTFSSGSLFSSLGEDLSAMLSNFYFNGDHFRHVDLLIDAIWSWVFQQVKSTASALSISSDFVYVKIDNQVYAWNPQANDDDPDFISNHRLVELSYDADNVFFFCDADGTFNESMTQTDPSTLLIDFDDNVDVLSYDYNAGVLSKKLSLAKILAYQVVCAEFYTNSRVDYMYSAQLFRQFVSSYCFDDPDGLVLNRDTFTWNGVEYLYDFLSAHTISAALTAILSEGVSTDHYKFLRLLFGYNRSLRYVDYFTGGRPRPYPVLGVSVPVSNNAVSVVDTIHQNWFAKFLNQAYRVGRKLSDYTKGLFPNVNIKRDYHDPMWLGSISDMVDTPETSNTAETQVTQANSVTSNFVSNGERYAFRYETPQFYGVVIGIAHFDIARYYPHVIERNNFNVDRNDYFNPYLQLLGDQPIYQDELHSGSLHNTFAYTGRDMQYKAKVDRCFGVFSMGDFLPGWLYVAPDAEPIRGNLVQNPSYIRAFPSELNKFYTSMTGYSPATWYHFLMINTNDCNAIRPMIANPSLD